MNDLLTVLFVVLFLLSPLAWYQVITKAGYSGWWVLVDAVPQTCMVIFWVLERNDIDTFTVNNLSNLKFWFWASVLGWLAAWVMFIVFSFLAWPALEGPVRRDTSRVAGPTWARHMPAPVAPVGGLAVGAAMTPTAPAPAGPVGQAGQVAQGTQTAEVVSAAPGWYRSGALGAGEQSYWDGSAWTARRRWQNNVWVDLPIPVVEDAAVGAAPEPPA